MNALANCSLLASRSGIIDIEASGLSSQSYPVEIAVTLADGREYHSLIRPHSSWQYWDENAERIHGISRQDLMERGKEIDTICDELNQLCGGFTLYSDCWVFDSPWLNKLFATARKTAHFGCSPLEALLDDSDIDRFYIHKRHAFQSLDLRAHRALDDAIAIKNAVEQVLQERTLHFTTPETGACILSQSLSDSANTAVDDVAA